jgi:hypothetical protein
MNLCKKKSIIKSSTQGQFSLANFLDRFSMRKNRAWMMEPPYWIVVLNRTADALPVVAGVAAVLMTTIGALVSIKNRVSGQESGRGLD